MSGERRARPLAKGSLVVRRLVVVALLALIAVVLAACGDDGLSVHDVEPADAPPRDAELAEAGWPQAAAWIRREAEDERPVVMNVFASWCTPCKRELPVLNDAVAANPDVAFLGINHVDQRDNAEQFVEEQEIAFPTLYDLGGDVAAAVGGRAMPTTAFFDADGELVSLVSGELTERSLGERIDEIR